MLYFHPYNKEAIGLDYDLIICILFQKLNYCEEFELLILIDKCGCPGFKITKGSTPYLVIGVVQFKNFLQAEKASMAINELKKTLNIQPQFKFNKTSFKIKESFFYEICDYEFEVRALVADKFGINVPGLRNNSTSFYQYLVATLFQDNNDIFAGSSIKVNKNTDRIFQQVLTKYIKEQNQQHKIKKFAFSEAKNDFLIQLANMITGAISRSYMDDNVHAHQLLNILLEAKKIKNIWRLRDS